MISSTSKHCLFLQNGDVFVVGYNGYGQSGTDSFDRVVVPQKLPFPEPVSSIFTTSSNSFAVTASGHTYAWGNGTPLGIPFIHDQTNSVCSKPFYTTPTLIPNLVNVKQIVSNDTTTFVLFNDGQLQSFGSGKSWKRLRLNNIIKIVIVKDDLILLHKSGLLYKCSLEENSLVCIEFLSNVSDFDVSENHGLFILKDGRVVSWGINEGLKPTPKGSELGYGNISELECLKEFGNRFRLFDHMVPKLIPKISGAKKVAVSNSHSSIILENGKVYLFGSNRYGQVRAETSFSAEPLELTLPNQSDVIDVALVDNGTFVVLMDSSIYFFGQSNFLNGQYTEDPFCLSDFSSWPQPSAPLVLPPISMGISDHDMFLFTGNRKLFEFSFEDKTEIELPSNEILSAKISNKIIILSSPDVHYIFERNEFSSFSLANVASFACNSKAIFALTTSGDLFRILTSDDSDEEEEEKNEDEKEKVRTQFVMSGIRNIASVTKYEFLIVNSEGKVLTFDEDEDRFVSLPLDFDCFQIYGQDIDNKPAALFQATDHTLWFLYNDMNIPERIHLPPMKSICSFNEGSFMLDYEDTLWLYSYTNHDFVKIDGGKRDIQDIFTTGKNFFFVHDNIVYSSGVSIREKLRESDWGEGEKFLPAVSAITGQPYTHPASCSASSTSKLGTYSFTRTPFMDMLDKRFSGIETHCLFVEANGTVVSWGENYKGELGRDSEGNGSSSYTIHPLTNIVQVFATSEASFALRKDGVVYGWGRGFADVSDSEEDSDNEIDKNESAQDPADDYFRRLPVTNPHNIVAVDDYIVVHKQDKTLEALGTDKEENIELYRSFSKVKQIFSVDASWYFWVLKDDGTVYLPRTSQMCAARRIRKLSNVVQMSCSRYLGLAIIDNGKVVTWGKQKYGGWVSSDNCSTAVLGNPELSSEYFSSDCDETGLFSSDEKFRYLPGLRNIISVATGRFHGLALSRSGNVYGFGANSKNQLGFTGTKLVSRPVKLTVSNVVAIAAGRDCSVVMTREGIFMAGDTPFSQGKVGFVRVE
ncbi:hypothetical protein RCL1_002461 [Eukaryota sp. TZLM3-RCL]